ncbi:MAG TPA: hypothetical protein VG276_18765 [Actinomycetes bacterium]|nr:hypothetical protein [Actinomycetes bacterium]
MSSPLVLAHVEQASVHGGAAQLLRLGPLLGLLLVAAWAGLAWAGPAARTPRGRLGAGAAVTLGTAGAIHLALVGQHARESLAVGVFFAAAGLAELLLAVAAWRTPGSRRTALAAGVVVGGLLVLYGVSRLWNIPAFGGREAVDALGLLTKLLELAGALLAAGAAGTWRLPPVRPHLLVGATAVAVALAARGLFGLGAQPWTVAAVVAITVGIAVAAGSRDRETLAVAAADGAVLALLLRAGGLAPYLLAGVVAGLLRVAARRPAGWALAPVAVAALLVLAVPSLDARMELLHVSHAGDTVAWMAGFLAAAALTLGAWRSGRLPVVAGFFLAHLGLQGLRLLAGQTSLEAVEIPATSLGLFLLATVVLADPQLTPASAVPAALLGALAGGLDVTLRALGTPYAPLLAVTVALAVTAPFGSPPPDPTRQQATGETLAGSAPAGREAHRDGAGTG